jgi:hypothetical protein
MVEDFAEPCSKWLSKLFHQRTLTQSISAEKWYGVKPYHTFLYLGNNITFQDILKDPAGKDDI